MADRYPKLTDEQRALLLRTEVDRLAKKIGPDPYTFIVELLEEAAHNLYLSASLHTDDLRDYLQALAEHTASDSRAPGTYRMQEWRLRNARKQLLEDLEPAIARYAAGFSPPTSPEV